MIGIPIAVSIPLTIYFDLLLMILCGFSLYDIKHRRVPNVALAFFVPFALAFICLQCQHRPLGESVLYSAIGFLVGGLIPLVAAIFTNGGMGGGDIKLCALLGIIAGAYGILLILFFATLLAMVAGAIKRYLFRVKDEKLAFLPCLSIGVAAFIPLNLFW